MEQKAGTVFTVTGAAAAVAAKTADERSCATEKEGSGLSQRARNWGIEEGETGFITLVIRTLKRGRLTKNKYEAVYYFEFF